MLVRNLSSLYGAVRAWTYPKPKESPNPPSVSAVRKTRPKTFSSFFVRSRSVSPISARRMVECPTSVPKFMASARSSRTRRNSAIVCQFTFTRSVSFQKWSDTDRVNVNWHTMAEFLRVLEDRALAINFGILVVHSTIRRALIGDTLRDLTKNELNVFGRVLRTALTEGGFGLSFGLGYVHARTAPYSELKFLTNIVKEFRGVTAIHLREQGHGITESTEDAIKLANETGAKMLINHFVPIAGAEKEYETARKEIEALPLGTDFRFDLYPSSRLLLPLYTFLPVWLQTGGVDVMLANLNDECLLA